MWGLTSQPIHHSDKFWRKICPNEVFTAPYRAQTVGNSLNLPMPPRLLESAILTVESCLV